MAARKTLITYWAVLVVYGAIAGYFVAHDQEPPRLIDFLFIVAVSVLLYLWYFFDAEEHRFNRTSMLGGAVVLFTFIAIPYYLVRSRPQGQKLRSVLKFAGAVLLSFFAVLLGGVPLALLGSGA